MSKHADDCDACAGVSRVLFLCTGNACRSQIAEGWARHLFAGVIDAHSAGTHPKGVDPRAVRVMAEVGIDISGHTSKRPDDLPFAFDLLITLCDHAREACPVLARSPTSTRVFHFGFEDPPRLAERAPPGDDPLAAYRTVRDQIRAFVVTIPTLLA